VPQKKRETLLQRFKDGDVNVLIATDVAARGLHIPDVHFVVNFDLPSDAEDYVHRIGRTARAGASGTAMSLICETYAMNIMDIEQFIEHTIPVERDIAELMFKDAVVPDLSKLKSNRKKDSRGRAGPKRDGKPSGGRGAKPTRDNKPNRDSNVSRNAKPSHDNNDEESRVDRERRENGNPNRIPKKQIESLDETVPSPEEREAAKVAALEKRNSEPKKAPRIPLRGRRGQEVPAIG
jgi:ATP-dependent RNA helicase RhlB